MAAQNFYEKEIPLFLVLKSVECLFEFYIAKAKEIVNNWTGMDNPEVLLQYCIVSAVKLSLSQIYSASVENSLRDVEVNVDVSRIKLYSKFSRTTRPHCVL